MPQDGEVTIVALVVQLTSAVLVGVLSILLRKSTGNRSLPYWAAAWLSQGAALAALATALAVPPLSVVLQPAFILGQYMFAFLVAWGCRNCAAESPMPGRYGWMLLPGVLLAVGFHRMSFGDIGLVSAFHSLIMAYLFLTAYRAMPAASAGRTILPGIRVIRLALLLLTANFFAYVPINAAAVLWRISFPIHYLRYSPLYDLSLQVMLGFGMVLYVMEKVHEALEQSNRELAEARDRLEGIAGMDPLTEALNRRGFYSFMTQRNRRDEGGCIGSVATIDMDSLKEINDSLGHAAGDAAIRALTKALRHVIRADDLIIRWGGDEFLLVLFGLGPGDASSRLERVGFQIESVDLPGASEPKRLSISWGVAAFDAGTPLDRAIEIADSAMYRQKQARKAGARTLPAQDSSLSGGKLDNAACV